MWQFLVNVAVVLKCQVYHLVYITASKEAFILSIMHLRSPMRCGIDCDGTVFAAYLSLMPIWIKLSAKQLNLVVQNS